MLTDTHRLLPLADTSDMGSLHRRSRADDPRQTMGTGHVLGRDDMLHDDIYILSIIINIFGLFFSEFQFMGWQRLPLFRFTMSRAGLLPIRRQNLRRWYAQRQQFHPRTP